MAEVAGLVMGALGVVGLAGLFNTCMQFLDQIETGRDIVGSANPSVARLIVARHLLKTWGDAIGFRDGVISDAHHPKLDDDRTREIVFVLLANIENLMSDQKRLVDRYGLVTTPAPATMSTNVADATKSISGSQFPSKHPSRKWTRRVKWGVSDKNKFASLVTDLEATVSRLYAVISPIAPVDEDAIRNALKALELNLNNTARGQIENLESAALDSRQLIFRLNQLERVEVLNWLKPLFSSEEFQEAVHERVPGTCEWILENQSFVKWAERSEGQDVASCLWIHSGAGFGKTFISAKIIEHIRNTSSQPLAYFFCVHEDEEKRRPTTILRSWIAQIAVQRMDAFREVQSMRNGREGTPPTVHELWSLFRSVIQKVPNCRFAVDGLDECSSNDPSARAHFDGARTRFLENLLQAIQATSATVVITSRDETDIRKGLRLTAASPPSTQAVEHTITPEDSKHDIEAFARLTVVEKLSSQGRDMQEEIALGLSSKAQGMFLWVRLEKARLKPSYSPAQLRKVISDMPSGLDRLHQTYERSLLAISELQEREDRDRAHEILRWTLFAPRPLSVGELAEALVVRDSAKQLPRDDLPSTIDEHFVDDEISGLCGSLISIRGTRPTAVSSWTVHLSHFSIKEYIVKQTDISNRFSWDILANEKLSHGSMAKTCITYLLFRDFEGGPCQSKSILESKLRRYAFLGYASTYWAYHIRVHDPNSRTLTPIALRLFDRDARHIWEQVYFYQPLSAFSDDDAMVYLKEGSTSPLYYASLFGLTNVAEELLHRGFNADDRGGAHESSLHAAAHSGHDDVVSLLIATGAPVDLDGALLEATRGGHQSTLVILLDHGANLPTSDSEGNTALHIGTRIYHVSICQLLVARGADVSVQDNNGQNPLISLLELNDLAPLETVLALIQLLATERTVNVLDRSDRTAMNYAVYHPYSLPVTQELLRLGSLPDPLPLFEESPLFSALRGCEPLTAMELLRHGANPYRSCWARRTTPLHMASRRHYTEVVRAMLDSPFRVRLNTADTFGCTPLHDAIGSMDDSFGVTPWSEQGDETVKLLLERGAPVEALASSPLTTEKFSPLQMAAARGLETCMTMIISGGGSCSGVSMHKAAQSGLAPALQILLKQGSPVNGRDEFGYTPLHFAAQKSKAAVRLLLDAGADVNARTNAGMTPLQFATKSRFTSKHVVEGSIAHMLIKAGAKVD